MTKWIAHACAVCLLVSLTACEKQDVGRIMESYMWSKRVLVVLAPAVGDARLKEQQAIISKHQQDLKARDVVVWQVIKDHSVALNGSHKAHLIAQSFYEYFSADPDKFTVLLISKDGTTKFRLPEAVDYKTLIRVMDAAPVRR